MTKLTKVVAMGLATLTLVLCAAGMHTKTVELTSASVEVNVLDKEYMEPIGRMEPTAYIEPQEVTAHREEVAVAEEIRVQFDHKCNMVVTDAQLGNRVGGGFVEVKCTVCGNGEITFF